MCVIVHDEKAMLEADGDVGGRRRRLTHRALTVRFIASLFPVFFPFLCLFYCCCCCCCCCCCFCRCRCCFTAEMYNQGRNLSRKFFLRPRQTIASVFKILTRHEKQSFSYSLSISLDLFDKNCFRRKITHTKKR